MKNPRRAAVAVSLATIPVFLGAANASPATALEPVDAVPATNSANVSGVRPTEGTTNPVDPGPVDPAPTEPPPVDPAPTEPPPVDPAPTEPPPVDPAPVQPDTAAIAARRASVGKRASRTFTMRTRGTHFGPLAAAARLTRWARSGRAGYHNQCLRLVDDAYGVRGGRTSTALRQWQRAVTRGFAHHNREAPVGAQLFWRTGNPAGHIAAYIGGGKVVTNVPGGRVKIRSWRSVDRWGPYLGWAEPYYS